MMDFPIANESIFPENETHKNLDKTNCLVCSENIHGESYPPPDLW